MKRSIRHASSTLTSPLLGSRVASHCRRTGVSPFAVRQQASSSLAPEVTTPAALSSVKVTRNVPGAAPNILDPDTAADTELVDALLAHTRHTMGPPGSIPHHIIAYSGGVDSSLVAALVHYSRSSSSSSPQQNEETVQAVLGVSPAVPAEQVDLARLVASHIGVPLTEIPTTEGSDEMYIENNGQACLACKTHLYSTLEAVANHSTTCTARMDKSAQQPNQQLQQLYNGTNADDLNDPTRLGLIAANNFSVASPIAHIPKDSVRRAARHLGLPNWNYAASPCLRSRLALGVPALSEHLQQIERAERFVRKSQFLAVDETSNLRVRLLAGNRACIEVDVDKLEAASEHMNVWKDHFVNVLGFASVTVRSFKSGSVATPGEKDNNETVAVKDGITDDRVRAALS